MADSSLLNKVGSKFGLYEQIVASGKSLDLLGPVEEFGIQFHCGNHPRIWIIRDGIALFDVRCTDYEFCKFVENFFANTDKSYVRSRDIPELRDKLLYLVIGLTGDHFDENGKIKDGTFTSDKDTFPPRYWPMVVGVIAVDSGP